MITRRQLGLLLIGVAALPASSCATHGEAGGNDLRWDGIAMGGVISIPFNKVGDPVWICLPQPVAPKHDVRLVSQTLLPQSDVEILGYRTLDAKTTDGVLTGYVDTKAAGDNPLDFASVDPGTVTIGSRPGPMYTMVHFRPKAAIVTLGKTKVVYELDGRRYHQSTSFEAVISSGDTAPR